MQPSKEVTCLCGVNLWIKATPLFQNKYNETSEGLTAYVCANCKRVKTLKELKG